MLELGFVGWLFLAIAGMMTIAGIYSMTGAFARHISNIKGCPYTVESMIAASRWTGLSIATFGLGLGSFLLMNKILFTIGAFGCTVGLITFMVMIVLSHIVGTKASAELVRKDETDDEEENIVDFHKKDDNGNDGDDSDDGSNHDMYDAA